MWFTIFLYPTLATGNGARGSIPTKSNPMGTTTANPQGTWCNTGHSVLHNQVPFSFCIVEPQQPSTSSGGIDDTDTPTAGAATASAADSEGITLVYS